MKGISRAHAIVKGASPLLMHNPQLADPLNEWTIQMKEITSKHHSKKTDADGIMLRELEWQGGLYFDSQEGPYLPGVHFEGAIRNAARSNRKGTAVESGLTVEQEIVPVIYTGPREREALYTHKPFGDNPFIDYRPVQMKGGSKIMRTRPRFNEWTAEFDIMTIDDIVNISDIRSFLELGGMVKAVGDYRPKFGRFVVEEFIIH